MRWKAHKCRFDDIDSPLKGVRALMLDEAREEIGQFEIERGADGLFAVFNALREAL